MTVTASEVEELRERTGVGLMDAKNALADADGDMDAAIDLLSVRGLIWATPTGSAAREAASAASAARQAAGKAVVERDVSENMLVLRRADYEALDETGRMRARLLSMARAVAGSAEMMRRQRSGSEPMTSDQAAETPAEHVINLDHLGPQ